MGIASTLTLLVVSASVQDTPVRPVRRPVAITGARIHTVSGAILERGTIVIEGGRIKSVGPDTVVPGEATVIDGSGKVVIPGLIDAGSTIFVPESDADTSGSAEYDVLDGLDLFPASELRLEEAGVTCVLVRPTARGIVAGLAAVLHLGAKRDPERLVMKRRAALKMTLGFSGGDTATAGQRHQDYRGARHQFESAQQYKEAWEKYRKDLAEYRTKKKQWDAQQKKKPDDKPAERKEGERDEKKEGAEDDKKEDKTDERKEEKTEPPPKPDGAKPPEPLKEEPKKPARPKTDPRSEVLLRALSGDLPVHIEAHAADSIRHALALATEFKLKIVLEGATESHLVADEIAKAKVAVIVGPLFLYDIPKVDFLRHDPACAATLAAAQVDIAIASLPSRAAGHRGHGAARFLLEGAAVAVSHGLPRDRALRAVTLDAARILRLEKALGSVEAGKSADLVLLSGEPFDAGVRVDRTLVGGETVFERREE